IVIGMVFRYTSFTRVLTQHVLGKRYFPEPHIGDVTVCLSVIVTRPKDERQVVRNTAVVGDIDLVIELAIGIRAHKPLTISNDADYGDTVPCGIGQVTTIGLPYIAAQATGIELPATTFKEDGPAHVIPVPTVPFRE